MFDMFTKKAHLDRELLTISKMVGIYCTDHHADSQVNLCESCQNFLDYAELRLQKCPYGEDKPTCAHCPIHCYKPAQRAQSKVIMRYAGPRMLLRHPILTITHKLDGLIQARHPRELTREQRMQIRNREK